MVIDAFTKFIIAKPTRTLSSVETIEHLRWIFGEFGYPRRDRRLPARCLLTFGGKGCKACEGCYCNTQGEWPGGGAKAYGG